MHEEVVGAGAAIHVELAQGDARVGLHGNDQVGYLVGQGLQAGTHNVSALGAAGQAHNGAASFRIPIGSAQAREGRHHVHASGVGHALGNGLGFPHVANELQLVPEPLHERAGNEHAALQGIFRARAGGRSRNGGAQVVSGTGRSGARVHKQKAASAVGVLGLARLKAALAEQGRLLVARHACNGNTRRHGRVGGHAEDAGGRLHIGQHVGGNAPQLQKPGIPAAFVDVVQHGAAGVGGVGGMHATMGQGPNKPAVNGAKSKFSLFSGFAGTFHVIKNPAHLAGRIVGIGQKARLFHHRGANLRGVANLLHQTRRAAALPHNSVAHRLAGFAVPYHRGFALIGNANAVNVVGR